MNLNTTTIVIVAIVIIAIIYLISVFRKKSAKTTEIVAAPVVKTEAEVLKERMAPIVKEIETQQVASFIKHWSDKFANNTLSVQDVELLNAKLAEGSADQVDGILALHPDGRKMFLHINEEMKQSVPPTVS